MELLTVIVVIGFLLIINILNKIKDFMLANNQMLYDIRSSLSYTQGYADSINSLLKNENLRNLHED